MLVLVASGAWSQVIQVQDEDGNPVPAAVIRNDVGEVRMTDLEGRLELDSLIRKGDTLQVRSMGFGEQSLPMPTRNVSTTVSLSSEAVNLSEVVVASGLPQREIAAATTMSTITADMVSREVPSNAATLLWRSGQVHVQQSQQGGGSPILRGFEANRILLVVDGVRMNNAIYRSGHLQNAMTIDPFTLASTEVLHGAGSVQYGSDALGGVIHYHSRSPRWETGSRARGLMQYSSAAQSPTIHADAEVTRGKWAFLTSVTHRRYGDLRMGSWRPHGSDDWGRIPWTVHSQTQGNVVLDSAGINPDADIQPGTGFDQTDVLQKVRLGGAERHVELNVQHSTTSNVPRFDRLNDAADDGGPKWAQWDYGPQRRTLISARFRGRVQRLGMVSLTAAWQQVEESRLKARFGSQEREVQKEQVSVASVAFDVDRYIRRWQTSFGAFWSGDRVNSEAWMERRADGLRVATPALTRYPNGGSEMGAVAAYAGASRRWNTFFFQGATRYTRGWLTADFYDQPGLDLPFEAVSYNRGALTGSATVRWMPVQRMGLHAVLSTAFRNPNVDDVGKVRAKDGYAILPSDGLRPERLASAELGGRWRSANGKWTGTASGFFTGLRDAIVPVDTVLSWAGGQTVSTIVVEGDTNLIQVNANIGRASISGSQWQVGYRAESGWRFRGTANFTRGRDAVNGGPLAHIPPLFGRLSGERSWDWLTLEAHVLWSGRKGLDRYGPGTTDNLAETLPDGNPGWWTVGSNLEGRLTERTTVSLGIHNILDRHYKVFASGISAPGRDIRCGIRWAPAG